MPLFCIFRVFNSEYSSRFTQPTKFKYVDGVWIETPVSTEATYNVMVSILLPWVIKWNCKRMPIHQFCYHSLSPEINPNSCFQFNFRTKRKEHRIGIMRSVFFLLYSNKFKEEFKVWNLNLIERSIITGNTASERGLWPCPPRARNTLLARASWRHEQGTGRTREFSLRISTLSFSSRGKEQRSKKTTPIPNKKRITSETTRSLDRRPFALSERIRGQASRFGDRGDFRWWRHGSWAGQIADPRASWRETLPTASPRCDN